jgi:hypothetical protein
MYCLIVLPFFSTKNVIKGDLLCRNPCWRFPSILSTYGLNLGRRTWDEILYEADNTDTP